MVFEAGVAQVVVILIGNCFLESSCKSAQSLNKHLLLPTLLSWLVPIALISVLSAIFFVNCCIKTDNSFWLRWESLQSRLLKIWWHQHQLATCWDMSKNLKKCQTFGQKHTSKHAISFTLCNVLLLSQIFQKCNNKWKVPIFFLSVIIWYALNTRILQILMPWQITNVGGILWHPANITTCLRHFYSFPN